MVGTTEKTSLRTSFLSMWWKPPSPTVSCHRPSRLCARPSRQPPEHGGVGDQHRIALHHDVHAPQLPHSLQPVHEDNVRIVAQVGELLLFDARVEMDRPVGPRRDNRGHMRAAVRPDRAESRTARRLPATCGSRPSRQRPPSDRCSGGRPWSSGSQTLLPTGCN